MDAVHRMLIWTLQTRDSLPGIWRHPDLTTSEGPLFGSWVRFDWIGSLSRGLEVGDPSRQLTPLTDSEMRKVLLEVRKQLATDRSEFEALASLVELFAKASEEWDVIDVEARQFDAASCAALGQAAP
jgi:hypothetical protein